MTTRRWKVTQVQRVTEVVEVSADTETQAMTKARRLLPTIRGLNKAHVLTDELRITAIEGEEG